MARTKFQPKKKSEIKRVPMYEVIGRSGVTLIDKTYVPFGETFVGERVPQAFKDLVRFVDEVVDTSVPKRELCNIVPNKADETLFDIYDAVSGEKLTLVPLSEEDVEAFFAEEAEEESK